MISRRDDVLLRARIFIYEALCSSSSRHISYTHSLRDVIVVQAGRVCWHWPASLHTHAATTHNNAFESMYLSQSECAAVLKITTQHMWTFTKLHCPRENSIWLLHWEYKIEILKFLGAHVHLPLHSISQRNRPYMRARFYLMSEWTRTSLWAAARLIVQLKWSRSCTLLLYFCAAVRSFALCRA
jgi:hypothetical protein